MVARSCSMKCEWPGVSDSLSFYAGKLVSMWGGPSTMAEATVCLSHEVPARIKEPDRAKRKPGIEGERKKEE